MAKELTYISQGIRFKQIYRLVVFLEQLYKDGLPGFISRTEFLSYNPKELGVSFFL